MHRKASLDGIVFRVVGIFLGMRVWAFAPLRGWTKGGVAGAGEGRKQIVWPSPQPPPSISHYLIFSLRLSNFSLTLSNFQTKVLAERCRTPQDGDTPLLLAASEYDAAVVEKLLAAGADAEATNLVR